MICPFRRLMVNLNYMVSDAWLSYSRGPDEDKYWVSTFHGKADLTWWSSWKVAVEPNGILTDGNHYCATMDSADEELLRDGLCSDTHGVLCLRDSKQLDSVDRKMKLNNNDLVNRWCPEGWTETGASGSFICYKPMSGTLNYDDAESACASETAHLPSFHSWNEFINFIRFR